MCQEGSERAVNAAQSGDAIGIWLPFLKIPCGRKNNVWSVSIKDNIRWEQI